MFPPILLLHLFILSKLQYVDSIGDENKGRHSDISSVYGDILLPTMDNINKLYEVYLSTNATMKCDICQGLFYGARHELKKRQRNRVSYDYGQHDYDVEMLLESYDFCDHLNWETVKIKSDFNITNEYEPYCDYFLDEGLDIVADALMLRSGKAAFVHVVKQGCVDKFNACNELNLWSSEEAFAALDDRSQRFKSISEQFLEENKTRSGVLVTQSGLQYRVVKPSIDGPKIDVKDKTQVAVVAYNATLINGMLLGPEQIKEYDIYPSRLIAGLVEGLSLTGVGGDIILYIPSNLGYGEYGLPPTVGENMVLVYRIQMKGIKLEETDEVTSGVKESRKADTNKKVDYNEHFSVHDEF